MQVVVALCHFCELTGPSVVFTTQTRPLGATADIQAELLGQGYEVVEGKPFAARTRAAGAAAVKEPSTAQVQRPPVEKTPSTAGKATARSGSEKSDGEEIQDSKPKQPCHACQSFSQQHHGFISADPATSMHYITSQEPYTAELYGSVRSACLRSLSSEVCPGREGPVLFGSDQQGYVFSQIFYLEDSEARGRTRLCSIIVCSADKLLLSSSWLYLVECCTAIADELRTKASAVFEQDQQSLGKSSPYQHIPPSTKGYRRPEQVRSIAELCNQSQLYFQLHQSFSWMLNGLFTRVQPLRMTFKKKTVEKRESFDDDLDEDDAHTACNSLTSAASVHQYDDDNAPRFSSLKHIHQLLGAGRFHVIANHVVRGSQIIVRSDSCVTNTSTLDLLGSLLPAGCCSTVPNSDEYLNSYRCNLLGMRLETPLPQHLGGSEVFVLLDIIPPNKMGDKSRHPAARDVVQCVGEGDPFHGYHFSIFSGGGHDHPRTPGPLILQRLTAIVGDPCLNTKATTECLNALKEEWMSKVHIAYRFSRRAAKDATADRPRLLRVLQVGPEELPVLQFWLRALDSEQRSVLLRL